MTSLLIEPEAEVELEQTATYYEDVSPGLGLDFLAEIRQRTSQIVEAPHRYPPFGSVEGVQCAHPIGRFPHVIVYMEIADVVHLIAFMHPRQRPGYWMHRVPNR
ncbi:MAG TPA: type II toxin-antitoxin system RelE/ParE family toxin [Polyangiaceae bacterium]